MLHNAGVAENIITTASAQGVDIAMGADDTLHAVWVDGGKNINYSAWDGVRWSNTPMTIGSGSAFSASVGVSPQGIVYAA
jgi:hypothetical protein